MDDRLAPEAFWPRLRSALSRVAEDARTPPPDARTGAVLVLLEDTPDGPSVVLTRRRRDLRSHPGQISFAGGRVDPDETIEEAALREAHEEIGLRAQTVEVLGVGPVFFVPPSRFWVAPVVARWLSPHDLNVNPWEVDAVLRVPIAWLLEEARWRHVPLSLRGSMWAWQLDDDLLWGATAMVVAQLLDVAVADWAGGRVPEGLAEDLAMRPWEVMPSWQRRIRLEGNLPEVPQTAVAHVTAAQLRALADKLADHGLPLPVLAEQAARALAQAARRLLGTTLEDVRVTVLAGGGGNGAGGLAGARLLASAGANVTVVTTAPSRLPAQLDLLAAAGVDVVAAHRTGLDPDLQPGDVVVDAMVGSGARPPLRAMAEAGNDWLRRHDVPVVALDLPSGLSPDDGLQGVCVAADVTVALGAPARGLLPPIVHPYVGDLYLADLGIPAALWKDAGVTPPAVFGRGPLVRLTADAYASDAATPDQSP